MVKKIHKQTMPILPLRDVVVYPNMVVPLFVGRTKSIKSLEDAMNNNNKTIIIKPDKASIVISLKTVSEFWSFSLSEENISNWLFIQLGFRKFYNFWN